MDPRYRGSMGEEPSQLKQLMFGDDSPGPPPQTMHHHHQHHRHHMMMPPPMPPPRFPVLDQPWKLNSTLLGTILDDMMLSWTQVVDHICRVRPIAPSPVSPVSPEHAKEMAELCIKQWRDVALDSYNEFTRLSMMWSIERPYQRYLAEERDLDAAIARQEQLLYRTRSLLERRSDEYFNNPNN